MPEAQKALFQHHITNSRHRVSTNNESNLRVGDIAVWFVMMIYLGYGSNLWLEQMAIRCPESTFLGLGRLPSYKWIINERGYANILEVTESSETNDTTVPEVWGLVYEISSSDESRLDLNEGVPYAYTKEYPDVDFWKAKNEGETDGVIDVTKPHQSRSMLVYIDHKRTREYKPKGEYIYRMNRGIADALKLGVPQSYVDRVLRKFIPAYEKLQDHDVKQALEQAKEFRDDSWKADT